MSTVMVGLRKLAGPMWVTRRLLHGAGASIRLRGRHAVSGAERIAPSGNASLSIPVKAVVSDAADHFELRDRIVALGRLLRPMQAVGRAKRRFGSAHDGGYVMLDDLAGLKAAFSLGVAGNVDWDLEMAQEGLPVLQFDHSIDDVPATHPLCTFHAAMIGPQPGQVSFDALVTNYTEEPLENAAAIMKMDIEHWEWPTLAEAQPASLRKIRQLTVEFHCMDLIADQYWYRQAHRALSNVREELNVVHVHANAIGGSLLVGGVPFPNVLEVTFASRQHYTFDETNEQFPTALDGANDPRLPDLYLGSFKF
jgi:hypothetical protein